MRKRGWALHPLLQPPASTWTSCKKGPIRKSQFGCQGNPSSIKKKKKSLCVLGIKEKVICVFGENRLCQGCSSGQSNLVPRPRTGFLPNPHSTGAALPRPWASAAGMPASPLSVLPVCTAKVPSLHSIPVPMGECC